MLPGVSFADLAFERLGVDPLAAGVRVVDGHRFATQVASSAGPLLVGQCDSPQVLSERKLALASVLDQVVAGDEGVTVTVLKHLGLADEEVTVVPWDELDRVVVPTTSRASGLRPRGAVRRRVRPPRGAGPSPAGGRPGDRVQTHQVALPGTCSRSPTRRLKR